MVYSLPTYAVCFLLMLVIAVLLVVLYLRRNYNYWKKRGVPFLQPTSLFGNFYDVFTWNKTVGEKLEEFYRSTEEPYIGIYVLDRPFLMINNLDLVKRILLTDFRNFTDKTIPDLSKHDRVGSYIPFSAKGTTWVKQRKLLSPVFSTGKLKSKTASIIKYTENMSKYILNHLKKSNGIMEVTGISSKYIIDILASSYFGLELSCLRNEQNPFLDIFERAVRWKKVWYSIQFSYLYIAQTLLSVISLRVVDKFTEDFFRKLTWDLINDREKRNVKNNDLVDILKTIKDKEHIDDSKREADALVALVAQMYLAGSGTTSTTMAYALYEMAKHPEVQELAREEVQTILDSDGCFTYKNIHSMTYLDRVLSETLRLHPIVTFLDRVCTSEYKIPGTDLVIEKGQLVYISVSSIQKDPKYFPEPDRFDPDRFLPENVRARHEFTYLPFSDGPRKCPAIRFARFAVLCGIAAVLRNFRINVCDKTRGAEESSKTGVFLHPANGVYLEFVELSS